MKCLLLPWVWIAEGNAVSVKVTAPSVANQKKAIHKGR
jgi:hypothetical protein